MEKVLKKLTVAGKFIGATELEAKLEEAVSQIKRTLDSHHLSTCDAICTCATSKLMLYQTRFPPHLMRYQRPQNTGITRQ
ncbi:hypothetical protein F2Q70_00002520 [Brassica cretica]|uniref:Uncharacterized protein n=1 Tax=Brassica cretica TaxID=69181 RepID=A0A8S9IZF8_BRACR|nr:hypothetical protein F2Q70_00002520 [Brassica cretica]